MKKFTFTITLDFTASENKLLEQFMRESKDTLQNLDAVVFKLAKEGIRVQLEEKRKENVERWNARKRKQAGAT